jgi:hypothetical protein
MTMVDHVAGCEEGALKNHPWKSASKWGFHLRVCPEENAKLKGLSNSFSPI